MKKKDFLILLSCFLVLALLVPGVLLCWGFWLPAQYSDTFLGELPYKFQRLEETQGKRIVIIGGSSVAFGVDSALIAQAFPDYQVVNFGLYAALGTKLMVDLAWESLRGGDIVILSPEQNSQSLSLFFDGASAWQGFDGAFSMAARVAPENWGAMLAAFPEFAAAKFRYVRAGNPPTPTGIYRRDSFNEYGDISADCPGNTMPGGFDPNTPISFDIEEMDADFVEYLNDFGTEMGKNGVQVFYRFPPMNALAITGGNLDDYYDALQSMLDFPILGNPHHCVLDAGWFFDTNFHLNSSGKIRNTRNLIRDLKAQLGDSSPTEIAIPTMPPPVSQNHTGDNGDAAYFTYRIEGETAVLTGLTEEGKKQTILTVPSELEGCPVTRLGRAVFAGNGVITKIVVPPALGIIDDGAFDGCKSLAGVYLRSANPGDCLVGQHLLDGTEAKIYVPADALTDYRLHYFWASYAARIFPTEEANG